MGDFESAYATESNSLTTVQNAVENVTPFEMAYKHFNNLWSKAQQELTDLLKMEEPYDKPPLIEQRMAAVRLTSKLYLQYIKICNKLITCYENICHPQKRRYLRQICDACIGRVLELKHELVSLEKSEFHFLDQMLLNLKMFPSEMDVKIPEYYKEVTREEDREKRKLVEDHLERMSEEKAQSKSVTKQEKLVRMAVVYIQMIQAHERARQSRIFFYEEHKKLLLKERRDRREHRQAMELIKTKRECAVSIQRAWRMFYFQKKLRSRYSNELELLNIGKLKESENIFNILNKDRLNIIKRKETEYLHLRDRLKQEMLTYSYPRMMEELEEKIRNFFYQQQELYGDFPDFPTEEKGGSAAMFEEAEKKRSEAESKPVEKEEKKDKKKEKKDKDKKEKDKKDKKGKDKKGKEEEEEPLGYSLKPSKYIPIMLQLLKEYEKNWKGKVCVDFDRLDKELVKEEVKAEIQLMVRLQVDENMRNELDRLSKSLRKDSKKKGKKKKGKKKGKKGKKKGKKGKAEPDLTPDRTLDSLVEELVKQEIIIDYPKYSLNDFLGDYNYSGSIKKLMGDPEKDPLPCLADIRRVVNEYCILPMGSEAVHAGGAYVKSLLLVGPKGSGKKSLMYAICNEIRATLMNLSAENIQGKYPGPDGLEMLAHLISKVSRLLQPTIVYIKDAESYFWKKKPAYSKLLEPGRLKKKLPKFIKKIKQMDRVLVCGTSVLPFDANAKKMSACYEKIICIFKPDYNCRSYLWREMIKRFKGSSPANAVVSVLSNVSDGFTAGHIETTIQEVLTDRRLAYEEKISLDAADFAAALAECVPVYEEEHLEYRKWLLKMPLGSQRIALYEKEREEVPEDEESEDDDY
ncbi:dynein regulatory complex protein 11 [Trichonephila inaurata madagascariensis]|uniref:Dynein regulatory complex protein 11 n=1 Tax=Trichonephila inaurata madagascariensis TaxID=2747483 RepID=A0A8X6X9G6_9ARAC|nr:dynein regulatory complex protein 11 [Trichonephila inaurata madagascariensis]